MKKSKRPNSLEPAPIDDKYRKLCIKLGLSQVPTAGLLAIIAHIDADDPLCLNGLMYHRGLSSPMWIALQAIDDQVFHDTLGLTRSSWLKKRMEQLRDENEVILATDDAGNNDFLVNPHPDAFLKDPDLSKDLPEMRDEIYVDCIMQSDAEEIRTICQEIVELRE